MIAGDSRGPGAMTQRCSVLNVPPVCWAQWGQFISLLDTKIQISTYAADCPGVIEKNYTLTFFCFFLSGDLDQMVWDYRGIG